MAVPCRYTIQLKTAKPYLAFVACAALSTTPGVASPCRAKTASAQAAPSGKIAPVSSPAADLVKRGREESDAGKFREAVATFTQALALAPTSVDAYEGRGQAYDALKDMKKALADFTESIRLSPDPHAAAVAFACRAEFYVDHKKNDEAIDDATRAIAHDAQYAPGYNCRGMAYLVKRKYDKALADFDEALRLNGVYAPAYYNRGNVYFEQGQCDKAVADYTRSLQGTPDTKADIKARIFNNRGVAYGRLKQDDAALGDFSAAIALSPKDVGRTYLNRADTYYDHKQWEKALADYRCAAQTPLEDPPDWIKNDQDWLPNRIKDLERKVKQERKM